MIMNFFLMLAFLFFIGSLAGWCLEVVFRKFFSKANPSHKWINPGFLNGPYLPLYGFGVCILFILSTFENCPFFKYCSKNKIFLFLSMGIIMTLIEYIAGIIFIKNLKVKLWDYSEKRGNIQGIICPQFSLIWVVVGAIYYYFVHPRILNALRWLSQNLAFSFFIGLFFGFFIIDVTYSSNILCKIRNFAKNNNIIVKYEELKAYILESKEKSYEKARFIFAMHSKVPIIDHLNKYYEDKKIRMKSKYTLTKNDKKS